MDRTPRILIVDDDNSTLEAYSLLMRSEGYEVLTASSAGDCLRIARAERPDLILLDVMLPDISGFEVCRRIKTDTELARILVLHISGVETSTERQAEALKSGADLYITKPVEFTKLSAQIHALLRIKNEASAALLDQQKRELDQLDRLSLPRASVAAQMFGAPPLRKGSPETFERLVNLYANMLDLALEQQAYKIDHHLTESLHAIVDQLGFFRAGPRDVVDIHRTALKLKANNATALKAQAYVEEGRIKLVELMGYLVSYYRYLSFGATPLASDDSRTEGLSAKEATDE